jgi:predicted transcriptional regulator
LDAKKAAVMTSSVYTPSVLSHEQLERLFVAREHIVKRITDRIHEASASQTRNHTLLVGPRGSGKTHLVSLAVHRIRASIARGDIHVSVAWLPEDPWSITTYQRFLIAVLDVVTGERPGAGRLLPDVEQLEHLFRQHAYVHGPVVVFTENLDQILLDMDSVSQQRLRRLSQSGPLLFVASATQLSADFLAQDRPFYNFFTVTRLEPLSVDDATEMLIRLGHERGDTGIDEALQTPAAKARLRTVAHLAGGQPRVWSILSNSLQLDGVDTSSESLMATFDSLTPYYQEQLARLSPNRRIIVSALVDMDRAVTIKDLAAYTGIDQRTISSAIIELKERAWVTELDDPVLAQLDKRLTYYELAEPLARIVFQMKTSRGEPAKLLVDFLTLWFDRHELHSTVDGEMSPLLDRVMDLINSDPSTMLTRNLLGTDKASPPPEFLEQTYDAYVDRFNNPDAYLRLSSAIRSALADNSSGIAAPDRLHWLALTARGDLAWTTRWKKRTVDTQGRWIETAWDLKALSGAPQIEELLRLFPSPFDPDPELPHFLRQLLFHGPLEGQDPDLAVDAVKVLLIAELLAFGDEPLDRKLMQVVKSLVTGVFRVSDMFTPFVHRAINVVGALELRLAQMASEQASEAGSPR